jgi:malonate-semialdehyde dehydrogenase (acetylating)/methylmalonate-semialdehyde dehydrogenase
VFNPATGEQIAELGLSGAAEVDRAVQAAKAIAPEWGRTPPLKRARYMFRFKELLDARAADIARAISQEHGKTHADASAKCRAASRWSNSPAASRTF